MPEIGELRQPREENTNLKQLVADLSLDRKMLQDTVSKNAKPARRRERVAHLTTTYDTGVRRACDLANLNRSWSSPFFETTFIVSLHDRQS